MATKKQTKAEVAVAEPVTVKSIKGFDKKLQCRSFQFAIGATYETDGEIKACRNGFHAIEGHPLEVFRYYPPASSRFAEVIQSGNLTRDADDSKVASAKITIGVELSLTDIILRAVEWVNARADWKNASVVTGANEGATASGDQGAATASGDQGAATASGYQGAATASGFQGAATASGFQGAATASGDQGAATASGDQGAATASGYQGAATASGDQGAATASGYQGAATASGDQGAAKGKAGCALFLVNRNRYSGDILHVWAGIAGRDGVKENVFYRLGDDGKPVEVE
jgi:hypothetical protein